MLQQENTGLLLVDVQGKLARIVQDSDRLLFNLERIIKGCQFLSIPIIWLEQNPVGLGQTVSELSTLLHTEKPIEKFSFNAFENEEFKTAIAKSKRQQWLVCGIEVHICVYQTAIGLLQNNFEVEILSDCVSSRTKENITVALNKLQHNGANLTTIEMCLYELVQNSKNIHFKEILNLIR